MICSIPFFIPVVVIFPNLFEGNQENVAQYLQGYSISLGAIQVASLCGILLATNLIIKKTEQSNFKHFRLTIDLKGLSMGFLFGTAFFFVIILLMQLTGVVKFSYSTFSTKIIFGFALYLVVAIGEEIMVRGYILNCLREKMDNHMAILVSSLIFGAMHIFNDDFTMIGFLNISLSGFLMGMILIKSNTISTPIGLHWAWNFIQGPVAGFNVSGNK